MKTAPKAIAPNRPIGNVTIATPIANVFILFIF